MFLNSRAKDLERRVQCLEEEVQRIQDEYWVVRQRHSRLMNYLGLHEQLSGVEIRKNEELPQGLGAKGTVHYPDDEL